MVISRRSFMNGAVAVPVSCVLPLPAIAQSRTKVRLAQPTDSLSYMSIAVARQLKYFDEEGIDLEVIVTGGDGPDVQALVAGEVQFVVTPPSHLFTLYQQGRSLQGIVAILGRCGINFVIHKDAAAARGITETSSFEQKLSAIKGLRIGCTIPGSLTFNLSNHYIKRAGLKPQVDAQVIPAGAGPAAIAAMENKLVDAYAYASPIIEQMIARGSSIMFINNTGGEDPELAEFLHAVLYVRPDYAQQNPDLVRRVTRALVRASGWISQQKPDAMADVLTPFFPRLPREILVNSIANTKGAVPPTGRITPSMVKNFQRILLEVGVLKAEVPFEALFTNNYLPA